MSLLQRIASTLAPIYPMAKRWLYQFHGGVFPKYNKTLSSRNPIRETYLPKELILPLQQAIGESAQPLVEVGAKVLKNQLIAQSSSDAQRKLVVPIHAPTSGTITAIEPRTLAHASGLQELCLILQPDGQHQAIDNALHSDAQWPTSPKSLKTLLARSGIIGMGGAGFPTYAKLPNEQGKIRSLIINGAECEPFITCDDLLMQSHADEIWQGAQIVAQALGINLIQCGIESNKPQAIAAMQRSLESLQSQTSSVMQIQEVATVYPMGGQKQLVYEMTHIELESGGHAIDQGLLMMNVATLRAIYRAVALGEPLTSRLVTVTGEGLTQGFNIDALIGTPFDELAHLAQPTSDIDYPLIMGGPMMGVQMPNNHVPVLKTTNCILANPPEPRQMQMPCIRCGECMDACPINLLPQQMYWHAQGAEYEKVEKLNIKDCIECGCCSYVCPSHIPLVQYYRHAKSEIKVLNAEKQAVELAKQRHEFKLARIEREKAEREARLKAKKEAVKKQSAQANSGETKKSPAASAAARAAAAKAASKNSAPMSAREKAIQAAQAAAANKQGQTDNDKKTKGQSLTTNKDKASAAQAAAKRAQAAAKRAQAAAKAAAANRAAKSSENSDNKADAPTMSAREKAIAAAKAAAKKKQTQTPQSTEDSDDTSSVTTPSAKERAIAAAKQRAKQATANKATQTETAPKSLSPETQTQDLTESSEQSSPALDKENARKAAIAKAREAALARKQAQKQSTATDDTSHLSSKTNQNDAADTSPVSVDAKTKARQAAMAAARNAAAKRAQQKQTSNKTDGEDKD